MPAGDVPLIQPLLLGGDCVPTPARLVFENVDGRSMARLRPEQIVYPMPGVNYESLMFEAGDETGHELLVCAQHDELTSNDTLLDSLIEHLLAPEPGVKPGLD